MFNRAMDTNSGVAVRNNATVPETPEIGLDYLVGLKYNSIFLSGKGHWQTSVSELQLS
jgi:hypothetical protein